MNNLETADDADDSDVKSGLSGRSEKSAVKTLVGMVTFGNLEFTKLAISEIRATTKALIEFYVVVGKPDDEETWRWLDGEGICTLRHSHNFGFPASINDIYDHAWKHHDCDKLIIAGNDIVPYPGAIDALIECAKTTDWEWICSSEYDSRALVRDHSEARKFFDGENLLFSDFGSRPWDLHEVPSDTILEPNCIKDVRNLCLFKRSVFEKIGYADVNFWPGGYFEDNDYCRRAMLAGVRACGLRHSSYFHFWSRTIHQASKTEVGTGDWRSVCFQRNDQFYRTKWGGPFMEERCAAPFGSGPFALTPGIVFSGELKIADRSLEPAIIEHWSSLSSSR